MSRPYVKPQIVESRRFLPHHADEIRASSIDPLMAAVDGVYSISHQEAYEIGLRGSTDLGGLCFRYWKPAENCFSTRFVRVKPDIRVGDRKYLQPVGELPRLYFVRGATLDILQDSKCPIFLTEGEKKALSLDGAARATRVPSLVIGLGGVWSWRHSLRELQPDGTLGKGRSRPLPEFDKILWKDRLVYLFFDSDVTTNDSVAAAESALAKELTLRGASVRLVRFQTTEDSDKVGFDDVVVRDGPSALPGLLADARCFQPPSDLAPAELVALAGLDSLPADPPPKDLDRALRRLASFLTGSDALRRSLVRESAVRRLKELNLSAPARLVDAALRSGKDDGSSDDSPGQAILLADPVPWPEAVNGADVLDDLEATFERFLALPEGVATTLALWTVAAHALSAFGIFAILALLSPEKRCGKTTALDLLSGLVPRPLPTANITAAALFRSVEKFTPTLLVDEAGTFLTQSDELRGVLNSGHRRQTAYVVRTVGDDHDPRMFSTWCAKAIALIGRLPPTLEDRALVVRMRRRRPDEHVARLRGDRIAAEQEPLKRRIARFVGDSLEALREAEPEIPEQLHDRAQDNWRPLFAVADEAGRDWPEKARRVALLLAGQADESDGTARIRLLGDLQHLFREREVDRLSSASIVEALIAMEDSPWPEWRRGRPLSPTQLARLLRPFGVTPRVVRLPDGTTPRGYHLDDLTDSFDRYLLSKVQHPQQASNDAGFARSSGCNTGPPVAPSLFGGNPHQMGIVAPVAPSTAVTRACASAPCPTCGEARWWQRPGGVITCAVCHPPASPAWAGSTPPSGDPNDLDEEGNS